MFAYNNQILLTQSVESTDGETDGETKIFEALYELDHPTAPASADIISAPLEEEEDYYSDKPSDPQPIWIGNNHCYTTRPSLSSAQGLPEIQLLSDNTTQELEHAFSRKEIQPGQKIELLILPNITSDLFLNIDEHGATQGRTPGQEEDKKEDKAEDDDAYPIFLAMLQYEPVTYNDLEFEDLEFEDLENDDLSLVHQDNGYSIESNHGRHFFVNTKDVPIDLTIHYNAPTTLLSERCSKNSFTNNSFNALKASQAPITLTRDEEAFIAAFLQASHEAGDRRTALASILGISDHQNAADVIFSTFKYMNRYLDAPFDCKPYMGEALSEKYTHLLHSILSKKGVCRHQAEIMHTFLNVFNIPSTLHTNATHTFLTLEDSTIIDLDYFSSPSAQNQYEHLCEQACTASERLTRSREKRSREKNNIPEQQKQALQSLIERAQPYIDYPHGDNTTPETFATLIEQFDQALQPFSPPLTQTAAVPTPAPKAKSTPVRTSQSVCASPKPIDHINIDHNNFISLLDDNQISPDQLYNTLTQSIDHNHGYQPWLMALESTNLKKRIHPPETDHTDPTASLKRRKVDYHDNTSSNIKTNIRVALKVIVSHMLSALPEETQTIQKFIPKGDDTVLPARAKEVSGGFIVNMTTPSPTIKKEIRLDLPDTFADEFILLTNHGPITISSQEGLKQITDHNHYTPLKLKSDLTSEINTFLQQYL